MTIVNVLVEEKCVTFITDTRGVCPTKVFDVMKVATFPHMRTMLATRGHLSDLEYFAAQIQGNCFDLVSSVFFVEDTLTREGVEVYLGGWQDGVPAAYLLKREAGRLQKMKIPYVTLSPPIPEADFEAFSADPLARMPAALAAQARVSDLCGGWANVVSMHHDHVVTYTMPNRLPEAETINGLFSHGGNA